MAQKGIRLANHLSSKQLQERYKSCKKIKEARRWQALWIMSEGASTAEAALIVGFASSWVRRLAGRYNKDGASAVADHYLHKSANKRLTDRQEQKLLKALEYLPPDGGIWSGPKVAQWIQGETGQAASATLGYLYLRRLGMTAQTPRRQHSRAASPEQRKAFKKTQSKSDQFTP